MSRKPRIHYPGAMYHLIARGNNKEALFFTPEDRAYFYELVALYSEKYDCKIYAFCLMTNHIHLAVEVSFNPLWKFAHGLLSTFSKWQNKRLDRIGHLFQGRYTACLVTNERYLLQLLRYIHLNPVRAQIVESPEQYYWSSHNAYLDLETIPWLAKERCCNMLGKTSQEFIQGYRELLDPTYEAKKPVKDQDWQKSCLGDSNDIAIATRKSELFHDGKTNMLAIIDYVCKHLDVSPADLATAKKHENIVLARAVITLVVTSLPGVSLQKLSIELNRTPSTLYEASVRLSKRLYWDIETKKFISDLKQLFYY